jgi:hypothetical protein
MHLTSEKDEKNGLCRLPTEFFSNRSSLLSLALPERAGERFFCGATVSKGEPSGYTPAVPEHQQRCVVRVVAAGVLPAACFPE